MSEWEGKEVSIAGRMMSKRVMGKASFCNVQDLKGNIQVLCGQGRVWARKPTRSLRSMDIGDIVGVKGMVFTTKTGEISIHAASCDPAFQEPPDSSGEVPRPDEHRYALPSEICGSDYE